MTPVLVRKEDDGRLLAVFPTIPGTRDPDSMLCYAYLGEHSHATVGYVRQKTTPATTVESERMIRSLRRLGYENPCLVRRVSPKMRDERVKEALR